MKERPILFSAPMVRAILSGSKTQTRRVVKPQPETLDGFTDMAGGLPRCPYGQPGERLWVREAFMHEPADYCWEASVSIPCRPAHTVYRADFPECDQPQRGVKWSPSIHMPRNLSRILLEITAVRVERLNEISEADAMAEGITTIWPDGPRCDKGPNHYTIPIGNISYNAPTAAGVYSMLWEQINGDGSWAANPWVWVVEFRRVAP